MIFISFLFIMCTYQELAKLYRNLFNLGIITECKLNKDWLHINCLYLAPTVTKCWQYCFIFSEKVLDTYEIEDTGNVSMDGDEKGIEVPSIDTQISEQQMKALRSLVNLLESSEEFRIDLFESTKAFMESLNGL